MKEIETKPLISIRSSASIVEAAQLISDLSIGALGVTDPNGAFVGLFTERDLAWVIAQGKDPSATVIGDVVNDFPVVVDAPLSWEEAAARFDRAHVRHLIVLQDGERRIVSARDLIRTLVGGTDRHVASASELRRWFGAQPTFH